MKTKTHTKINTHLIMGINNYNPTTGCNKEQRKLVVEANRLLREYKLSNKRAKNKKRVSS